MLNFINNISTDPFKDIKIWGPSPRKWFQDYEKSVEHKLDVMINPYNQGNAEYNLYSYKLQIKELCSIHII